MIHFKTKNNLLEWLIKHCPRKAIVRSLLSNGAECLGGFNPIPPSDCPGWIVRVTSVHGKKWIVAILASKSKPDYEIRILKRVPWEHYAGGNSDVYQGDSPSFYTGLKYIFERRSK